MDTTESDSDCERYLLSAKRRIVVQWKTITISEETLLQDWRRKGISRLKNSDVVDFYCSKGRYCTAKLKKKTIPNGVVTFLSNGQSHSNHRKSDFGLNDEQKKIVAECFAAGVTAPNNILLTFRSKNIDEPAKDKLNNYLQRQRKSLVQTNIENDVGDVIVWAREHDKLPDDVDKPFVVSYSVGDTSDPNCHVRIFISTVRLLKLAAFFKHIHADATYKLVHQGYPVLVAGVTDWSGSFHPCGIVVCKGECSEDYAFLFESLKKGVETVLKIPYHPEYLIADCAQAITNGAEETWGSIKRVYCYYHVITAIDKFLLSVKNPERRKLIRNDIILLRHSPSTPIFLAAADLFVSKWKKSEPTFTSYFEKQWLRKKPNWYLGFVKHGIPTTNNALESTNRYIKDTFTKRKRRVVGEFLENTFSILQAWSKNRNGSSPNNVELTYRLVPEISLLKKIDSWIKTSPHVKYLTKGAQTVAYIRRDGGVITASAAKVYSSSKRLNKWQSFEDFVATELDVHRVTFSENDYAPDYACTCVTFLKEYICIHTYGLAVLQDKFDLPPEAATGGLGAKRGPGRPKKCTKALVKE